MSEQAATERAFSANFHVWHPAGVKVQVTVRDGDVQSLDWYLAAAMAAIEKSLALGFSVNEPLPVEGEKLERIAGYVVGEYSDKGGEFMPCVFLYPDDKRTFKVATVYPESFHLLPFPVPAAAEYSGQAPDIDTARKKRIFHEHKLTVVMQPKLRSDGQPVTTDDGKVVYRFAGVQGAPPAPTAQALDENKAVEWAVKQNRFATADDALAALREQRAKFPHDDVDAFKLHWRDYVVSLPLLQAQPPAEEPDATPADDDPFDKPPAWRTPKDAQAWAVLNGHCANEHEATNSWANTVKQAGGFNKANAGVVFEAFYRKHMGRQMQPA